ncbi:MAG TPA: hypothetical protein VMZ92_11545 [Planctomycetota bacterium]|nr:hypothetical protein [Planctomycetota bacterium]
MTEEQKDPGTEEVRELRRLVARSTADIEGRIERLHQHTERRILFLAVYVTLLVFLVALAVTAEGARALVMTGLIALFLLALVIYFWQVLLAPHYARQKAYRDAISRVDARKKETGEGAGAAGGTEDAEANEDA